MKKNHLKKCVALLAATLTFAAAAASTIECEARVVSSFNKDWRFTLGDNPTYREPSYEDKKWRALNVPHDWSIEGDYEPERIGGARNGYFPEGIGWYRKSFTIPKDKLNKKFTILFDGIFMNAEVWVNGRFMGRRPFGFVQQRYDITSVINWEGENVVAVRVDNSLPEATRWYNGSGIYRNVHLIEQNFVHFRNDKGVYITTPVAERGYGEVKAKYSIMASYFDDKEIKTYRKNPWSRHSQYRNKPLAHDCIVRTTLYDADGEQVAEAEESVTLYNYDADVVVESTLGVNDPKRWSAEEPYLYTAKSEIIFEGRVLDDVVTNVGIRSLEYRPKEGMFVNNVETKLNGVCLHHDGGGAVGSAVPKKVWQYRLEKLKEIGCNAVRTGHTPFAPEFFDLCDSMGIYVFAEIFDEWRFGWPAYDTENNQGKALNGYHLHFDQWAESDLRDVVRMNRNHPSVIMYGIGNEIPDFRKDWLRAQATCSELNAICAEEDPTRPPVLGNSNGECGVVEEHPVIGFNSVGMNFKEEPAAKELFKHDYELRPNHLFLTSETSINTDYYVAYRDNPYAIGMFVWTGFNYFGEVKNNTKQMPLRGWKISLFDMSGGLLNQGALIASCWSTKPVVYATSSRQDPTDPNNLVFVEETFERVMQNTDSHNWNYTDVDSVSVVGYSNCEELELFINGRSQGIKSLGDEEFFATWRVPYTTGRAEIVAYDGAHRIASDEMVSTSKATQISAEPHWGTLAADGSDVDIIEVQILDAEGRLVTDATNEVSVSVKGGAELVGIDSGNLYYDGSYRSATREVTRGRLIVVVRSNGSGEKAVVALKSKGLQSAVVEI